MTETTARATDTRARSLRVGIDIGGTKTDVVLVADDARIIDRLTTPSGSGAEGVLGVVTRVVAELLDRSELTGADIEAFGVGIPGVVSAATGVVTNAVNLDIATVGVRSELERRLGGPVAVENDVSATALGVYRELGLGDGDSLAYVNVGTGLAAGLVLNGRLWRGATGGAGEIGHIPLVGDTRPCGCGQAGCVELSASGGGLRRSDAKTETPDLTVAAVLRSLALTLDIGTIALGGGLLEHTPGLLERVRGVLQTWSAASPFLQSYDIGQRIVSLPIGRPLAAFGAAMLPRHAS